MHAGFMPLSPEGRPAMNPEVYSQRVTRRQRLPNMKVKCAPVTAKVGAIQEPELAEFPRVVVAVGPRIYREGLAEGIQRRSAIQVAAAVGSTSEAVQALQQHHVDVVLLDTGLAGAASFTANLAACQLQARVVALAIGDTETDVCGWAALGIAGFLTTDDSLDDLTHCIAAVACGEFRCAPRHASMLLRRVAALSNDGERTNADGLTPRQSEIVALMRAGLSNKLIARQLGIELSTVKNHVHQVLVRLHLSSRAQLGQGKGGLPVVAPGSAVRSRGGDQLHGI